MAHSWIPLFSTKRRLLCARGGCTSEITKILKPREHAAGVGGSLLRSLFAFSDLYMGRDRGWGEVSFTKRHYIGIR